ncbi:MAG: hypothetical protein KJ923_04060 [Candidatus Omnitrophica bacterium]|nr:hypothetical protein [Candidatus Omnitrophota bacterium]
MNVTRKTLVLFFLCALCMPRVCPAEPEVTTELWNTKKSQHFIIYYQEAENSYIQKLSNTAERYYNSILDDLGYRRFDFWTWDNRAKIFLYKDADHYNPDFQREGWSGGSVHVPSRTIKTYIGQEGFFDSMLPHEMAHIIFREFIGENRTLPLWIDEGVACSQEKSILKARIITAHNLIKEGAHVDLEKFSKIKGSLPISPQIFYSQAASLIVFLLEQYGGDQFFEFSRQVRDGKQWLAALESVYRFRDLKDLEEKWKNYMLRS